MANQFNFNPKSIDPKLSQNDFSLDDLLNMDDITGDSSNKESKAGDESERRDNAFDFRPYDPAIYEYQPACGDANGRVDESTTSALINLLPHNS